MTDSKRGFLDDEYTDKIADLCDRYDVDQADIEHLYLDHCREFEQAMKDKAPRRLIRSLAFDKTESRLVDGADSL